MRALVQRVKTGSVTIDGKIAGAIGRGLVILLGIRTGDTAEDVNFVADKCANLRIFEDDDGKFNLSALNISAEILVISQFTLYGDCRKGRRPSFIDAAPPEISEPLYESFIERIRQQELRTQTGKFGANMLVEIHNDGPVTILVESKNG